MPGVDGFIRMLGGRPQTPHLQEMPGEGASLALLASLRPGELSSAHLDARIPSRSVLESKLCLGALPPRLTGIPFLAPWCKGED